MNGKDILMTGLGKALLIAVLAALIAVGGWTTNRAATTAERHPTRHEFEDVQQTIRNNQNKVDEKLDKIIDHLIKGE
jgi:predicted negative regulator of RcsB-dependent stress response